MRKILVCFLALLGLLGHSLSAQNPAYADVAVIVNDSSAVSLLIGNYYAQLRGIPANRVLHVAVPPVTTVDSMGFEAMRAQIEAELIGGNLLDSVNYLVTTKGMPARVSVRNGCDSSLAVSTHAFKRCTCVESELTLILGPLAGDILKLQGGYNPYQQANVPFSRDSFGIFLVGRLDGNTELDAKALVANGGPNRLISQSDVEVVLDNSGFQPGNPSHSMFESLNRAIRDAAVPLGYNVFMDSSGTNIVTNRQNVLAYSAAWYPDPNNGVEADFSFVPGSMVHLWYNSEPVGTDQPWSYEAGDAIANGAAVVTTYSSIGFTGPNFMPQSIMPIYLDTASSGYRFNAAEAAYQSNVLLSQHGVFYGDPKTSVVFGPLMSVKDPDGPAEFALWPNPTTGDAQVRMVGNHSGEATITVTDLEGRLVLSDTWNSLESYAIDCDTWKSGLYLVQITQGGASLTRKLSIVR